jgi:hypothetical protein
MNCNKREKRGQQKRNRSRKSSTRLRQKQKEDPRAGRRCNFYYVTVPARGLAHRPRTKWPTRLSEDRKSGSEKESSANVPGASERMIEKGEEGIEAKWNGSGLLR